ncbi:helix-turn-helix domain-containing protein [Metapseudomonas otitidis]
MFSPSSSLKVKDASEVGQQQQAIPGWKQEYTQVSSGAFAGRTVHAQLEGVEVFEERMNLRVEQEFHAPHDAFVFSFDMSDSTLYLLNGQTRNAWVTPVNYRELSVVFKHGELFQSSMPEDTKDLILVPLRSRYCQLFSNWLSRVLSDAASEPSKGLQPDLRGQLLEDCCFILEQGLERAPKDVMRADHARKVIHRVIERVSDTPQDNVSAPALATAAGVSQRRLQQIFREYSGMSPTQWLRVRRLNAARRDLMSSSAREATVAEIAMRCSFWHLGRFSESYHSLFGEHPSKTLKRQAA